MGNSRIFIALLLYKNKDFEVRIRNKIRVILLEMERKQPGILDNFTEEDINNIQEIKEILAIKRFKIINFRVVRDNNNNTSISHDFHSYDDNETNLGLRSIKFNFAI